MPSLGAQKRECRRDILRRLIDYVRLEPDRVEGVVIGLAARLANTMPLSKLREWQEQLKELETDDDPDYTEGT